MFRALFGAIFRSQDIYHLRKLYNVIFTVAPCMLIQSLFQLMHTLYTLKH